MSKIKRIICVLASMTMCLSLFGCNSDDNSKDDKESKAEVTALPTENIVEKQKEYELNETVKVGELAFSVSDKWEYFEIEKLGSVSWDAEDNSTLSIHCAENSDSSETLGKSYVEGYEKGLGEKIIEYEFVDAFDIENVLIMKYMLNGKLTYNYTFVYNSSLYSISCETTLENGEPSEMSLYFPDVINSVTLSENDETLNEQSQYDLDETVVFDESITYSVSNDWVREDVGENHQFFIDDFDIITFSDITSSDEYFSEDLLIVVVDTLLEQNSIIGYSEATVAGAKAYIVEENDTIGYMFAANGRCYIVVFTKTLPQNLIDKVIASIEITQNSAETPDAQEAPAESKEELDSNATLGMKNALESAKSYIKFSSFSYLGLIGQLEYEGYSTDEATYGADNCGADWTEQALLSAISYIDSSSFSYQGLVEQLEYEEFTHEQAVYGADNCGADWNEQAALTAQSYLDYSSFSRQELLDQLLYEGFTAEQAEYGVTAVGY